MSTSVAVRLEGISRRFGNIQALDGLHLDMTPGELVALLGPSGCGKTTALRILAGLEDADSGRILVGGKDIVDVPVSRRDMGMVFQAYSLFPHLTAVENVEFGLRLRRQPAATRRRRARDMLELVGIGTHADRYPQQLSGGQQQRVALARALAIKPQVLLLDEPLSALDAKIRVSLREEIHSLQRSLGITTIYVTHDQEEALSMSDRIVVMNEGRVEQIGTPFE
ncbi:MAG: ABC transporter ATP-binding protein, partial [Burkholderiales bacterium]